MTLVRDLMGECFFNRITPYFNVPSNRRVNMKSLYLKGGNTVAKNARN